MKKIFDRYDKKLLEDLPRVLFKGRIEVIVSENDAKRAVAFLLKQPLLGFDTETKPSFKPGRQHPVALLQVCNEETCFLFRLNRIGLTGCLIKLLEDTKITKVGLSWHDDLRALNQRKQFRVGTFIDLQDIAGQMGIIDISLQKLYANIFGMKISKRQQLTNWESDTLDDRQKLYAATDAWACIQLYKEIRYLIESGDYQLEIVKEEEGAATAVPTTK